MKKFSTVYFYQTKKASKKKNSNNKQQLRLKMNVHLSKFCMGKD